MKVFSEEKFSCLV